MILHLRKVIIIGPDEVRVVAYSPAKTWAAELDLLTKMLRSKHFRHGSVLLADERDIESQIAGRADLHRCSACDELRSCSVYENACADMAEDMSLLTVIRQPNNVYEWVGPPAVVEMAGIMTDERISNQLKRKFGVGSSKTTGESIRDSFKNIIQEEAGHVREFVDRTRRRVSKKVVTTAGHAAGAAVDQLIDNVVDIGTQRFKTAFDASGKIGATDRAARLLGVDQDASREQIEAAYRNMARAYHPDRNKSPEAAQKMAEINGARQILLNALK